jgi:hypothetical protein
LSLSAAAFAIVPSHNTWPYLHCLNLLPLSSNDSVHHSIRDLQCSLWHSHLYEEIKMDDILSAVYGGYFQFLLSDASLVP